jgi:hypothetical protein
MKITFDSSSINNTSLPDSKIFITFAAASADLTYTKMVSEKPKTEAIKFSSSAITIDGTQYGTSKAYSLADIAANELTLNSAISLVGFISYGEKKGIEKLAVGNQPHFLSKDTPRYSIFEISYDGTTGGADITNISQYGGSIKLEFLKGIEIQHYVANSLDSTAMFQALSKASENSTQCVYLDAAGKFTRIIGTNLFPIGNEQNPYPSYNAYLESLFSTHGINNSSLCTLTNLAPGQPEGGKGSFGFAAVKGADAKNKEKGRVTKGQTYNLDYHFKAFITQGLESGSTGAPNGTYSIKLKGHVNATIAGDNVNDKQSHKYDDLSITIAADDIANNELYMTNFIYQATNTGTGISVDFSGWSDVDNDFGTANVLAALKLKVAGDFAEGMTCGFVGSATTSTSVASKTLGELSSYEWWKNPDLAYAPAQTTDSYYSAYGNVVSANSDGKNGSKFSRGGVYGSPYDDRFGLNLISPDANTTEMKISLLEDGDLKPNP